MYYSREYYDYYHERQEIFEYTARSKVIEFFLLFATDKDLVKTYCNNILENEEQLLKELSGRTNRIELYFSLYYYLLWNGYLSYNNNFIGKKDENEIMSLLGLSISRGNGVCRNIAFHFNELLHYLTNDGYIEGKSYVAGIHIDDIEFSIDDYCGDKIKRNIDNSKSANKNKFFLPNHCINFCETNNDIYLYDATLFLVKKLGDYNESNEPKCIELRNNLFDGSFLLDYHGIEYCIKERLSFLEKIVNKMKRYEKRSINLLPEQYHIDLINEAIELCESNKKLLDDYKSSMHYYYTRIKRR